ncbi:MAG TPA: peptidoglycan-associated lipoprotein Pal [Methylomirabilota bacterium]|nr:peptidoglycan-associated lipoprotein Pal [Methylomirabilota bacterium]
MHGRMRLIALVLSTVGLALLMTGCPKRPGITVASAPPPAAPAPAPAAPAPAPAPLAATPAPAPPAPAPAEEYRINDALKPVYFAFDSSTIRPGDAKTLDASAAWLKAHPDQLTLIEGHCDERGTNEYNLALGERRAKAAMSYLVSKGVEAGRITMISYGKERPVCTEHNEACWSKNRRDNFLTKKQ